MDFEAHLGYTVAAKAKIDDSPAKPKSYSEVAIQTYLTLKSLFRLPYRVTEGLLKSLMRLCAPDLPVPVHTHMSRRAATLEVKSPRRPRTGATHVVVDSTGLKIFGEGEWKVCQHGVGKRRTWRKIHLAVDETLRMAPTIPRAHMPPLPSRKQGDYSAPRGCYAMGERPSTRCLPG